MTACAPPEPAEVPSPIDFNDPAQALAWVEDTIKRRPWRPRFFEAFVLALKAYFSRPFRVVELGSGPGHLAAAIVRACEVEQYTAVDLSPAMHDLARAYLGSDARPVRFLLEDFRKADWGASLGIVDAVVTLQAAHEVRHTSRLPDLFDTIFAVIRPNGLFLYGDHYREEDGRESSGLFVTRRQQEEALANAGFVGVALALDVGGMALYSARRP
ncbi:MAG: class I SAM-dependent methyltransferase [Methylocystis sp.]